MNFPSHERFDEAAPLPRRPQSLVGHVVTRRGFGASLVFYFPTVGEIGGREYPPSRVSARTPFFHNVVFERL